MSSLRIYRYDITQQAERPSPANPDTGRGVTDLHHLRGYTHPITRAIEVSHAACKAEFLSKFSLVDLTAEVYFFFVVFQIRVFHVFVLFSAFHDFCFLFFRSSFSPGIIFLHLLFVIRQVYPFFAVNSLFHPSTARPAQPVSESMPPPGAGVCRTQHTE